MSNQKISIDVKPIQLIFSIFAASIFWMIPIPKGMQPEAWHLLGIFLATIFSIVSKALPIGGCALLALSGLALTNTLSIKEALSGFSYPVIWLVVLAFFVAKSFIKTGLGIRLAYHFVSLIGKKSLGLSYGMALTDLALSPAIPSNTARAGGILFPIVKSLAVAFDSQPTDQPSRRKIGAFLIQSLYQCNIITSAMFITAMAANPMIIEIASEMEIEITWGTWALAALVPGLISLLVIPYLLFKIYPPSIKETPKAQEIAKDRLKELGKVKWQEWVTLGVFIFMMSFWIAGPHLGIDSTTVALAGISILIAAGVLTWNDLIMEKSAWDTMFWFSTLIMMATYLNKLGMIGWVSNAVQDRMQAVDWRIAYPGLVLVFYYIHYLFASNAAHVCSLFSAFCIVGIVSGVPPMLMTFSLAFCSTLSATLTHYGTAPAPILFGSGYVDLVTWWRLGAIVSIAHLLIWLVIGPFWWKLIGLW
ncbi:putative malate transporter yflS [Waddlia chondrophila 2032/99]|uniref:Putative transporter, divalent anion:Na+ symporter (DASS) family n=2 Tax=Waddlia chondrophila TaxID=71667 RepID=D6YWV2_WADCW|nr:anion permease [Waddlia chondrophila]ADI38613.1 putative transporter, divalent anion:Na+ symporter (DASS) family [Waddlia chondrophila WSU 86-1044]CCB91683.1 putative malate transporter yflS [Waddlia chondrophila 2032/99]